MIWLFDENVDTAILKKLLLYFTDFLSSYFFKILLKKLIDLVLTIYTCGIEKNMNKLKSE